MWLAEEGRREELWDEGLFEEIWEDPGRSPWKWGDRELSLSVGDITGSIWVQASTELLLQPGFDADGITATKKGKYQHKEWMRLSFFFCFTFQACWEKKTRKWKIITGTSSVSQLRMSEELLTASLEFDIHQLDTHLKLFVIQQVDLIQRNPCSFVCTKTHLLGFVALREPSRLITTSELSIKSMLCPDKMLPSRSGTGAASTTPPDWETSRPLLVKHNRLLVTILVKKDRNT